MNLKKNCLENQLYKFFRLICRKKLCSKNKEVFNPILLKVLLSEYNSFFKNNNQQDCHECIITILDILHEIDKNGNDKYNKNNNIAGLNSKESNIQWNKLNNTIIKYWFYGQFIVNIECNKCNIKRTHYELFNNISIPLENTDIVINFEDYMSNIIIEKINCEHCKCKTQITKNSQIWRFPRVLIIHLKRYIPNGIYYKRNNKNIEYSNKIIFKKNNFIFKYELINIINHIGSTPYGGHYTNVVKSEDNNKWYLINDSNIILNKDYSQLSKTAYILIYKLI